MIQQIMKVDMDVARCGLSMVVKAKFKSRVERDQSAVEIRIPRNPIALADDRAVADRRAIPSRF